MRKQTKLYMLLIVMLLGLSGCANNNNPSSDIDMQQSAKNNINNEKTQVKENIVNNPVTVFAEDENSNTKTIYGNDLITIDTSNISEGELKVIYSGDALDVKLQINDRDNNTEVYSLVKGENAVKINIDNNESTIGCTYTVKCYEIIKDDRYALIFQEDIK